MVASSLEMLVHIGLLNLATVRGGNKMIQHLKKRSENKFTNEEGSLRLGGELSPLHSSTRFRRKWDILKNHGPHKEAISTSGTLTGNPCNTGGIILIPNART